MDALVEELLTKDVYIVDYLPRTVPKNSGGQYFDVEYHLLNSCLLYTSPSPRD